MECRSNGHKDYYCKYRHTAERDNAALFDSRYAENDLKANVMAKEATWFDIITKFMAEAYGWPKTQRLNQTYLVAVIMKLLKDPPDPEILKIIPPEILNPIKKLKERRHKYRRTPPRYLRTWGLVEPTPTEWRLPPGLPGDIIELIPPEILGLIIEPPIYTTPGPGPTKAPDNNFVRPEDAGTPTDITIQNDAGRCYVRGSDNDFTTCRNLATGTGGSGTADLQTYSMSVRKTDPSYTITRSFFKFAIPDTLALKTITSAVMEIWGYYASDTEVTAQESTWEGQYNHDVYNDFTGVLFGSTEWQHGPEGDPVLNQITFNDQGQSFVGNNADSTIAICCREKLYDYDNNDPGAATQNFDNGCYFGDAPASPYRARLQVTYLD